jgi:peptidoglycan-associated lipoprotein
MKKFTELITLGLIAVFCFGSFGCKNKTKEPTADDTKSQLGDGLSTPQRPGNEGLGPNGGLGTTVDAPDLPGFEDPDDGVLIDRGNDFGLGANFTDPSRDLFEPVYFGFNQSALNGDERTKVENVANYLMNNQTAKVIVEGHCDWKGTTEYNIALGERRASSVKEFLLALGVSPNRVSVSSQGDLQATEDADSSIMARDRKARFIVN